MNTKSKELIEELKDIVMDLHRSASQLDDAIQAIEEVNVNDNEFMRMFVLHQCNFRNDYKIHKQYDELEKREIDIWKRLIESLKEGNP